MFGTMLLNIFFLLTGVLATVTAQDPCGWPQHIQLTVGGTDKVLAFNMTSQSDGGNQTDLVCSSQVLSPGGVLLRVTFYNISDGLSISWGHTDYPVTMDTTSISWRGGQFARSMVIPDVPFQVTYARPSVSNGGGDGSSSEGGFSLQFSYLNTSGGVPCRGSLVKAQPQTRLLYMSGYPFAYPVHEKCEWNVQSSRDLAVDVKLTSVSRGFGQDDAPLVNGSALQTPRCTGQSICTVSQTPTRFAILKKMYDAPYTTEVIYELFPKQPVGLEVEYTARPIERRSCRTNKSETVTGPTDAYVFEWSIQSTNESDLTCEVTFDTGSNDTVIEAALTEYTLTAADGSASCAEQTLNVQDLGTGTVLVNESSPQAAGTTGCPTRLLPFSTLRASGRKLTFTLSSRGGSDAVLTLVVKSREPSPSRDINAQVLEPATSVSYAWIPANQIGQNADLQMTLTRALTADCSMLEVWDKILASRLELAQKLSVFNGPSEEHFELTKDCDGNVVTHQTLFPRRLASLVAHQQSEGFWVKYQANIDGPCERVYTPVVGKTYTLPDAVRLRKHIDCSWHLIKHDDVIGIKTNFSSGEVKRGHGSLFSILTGNPGHELKTPLLTDANVALDPNLWLYSRDNLTVHLTVDTPTPSTSLEFRTQSFPASSTVHTSCSPTHLTATRQTQRAESLNYPHYLMSELDCEWSITRADPQDFTVLEVSSGLLIPLCEGKDRPVQLRVSLHSAGGKDEGEVDICSARAQAGFMQTFQQETVVVSLKTTRPVVPGFYFNYSTISWGDMEYASCNTSIDVGEGRVSHSITFHPEHFMGRTRCYWRFYSGSDSQAVTLTNVIFDLTRNGTCDERRDNAVSFSPVLDSRLEMRNPSFSCSMTSERAIVSQQSELLLMVYLRKYLTRPVTLTYTAETTPITGCGGTVQTINVPSNGALGELTSPNYPNLDPKNSKCGYILKSEDDVKTIEINVLDLDIPQLHPDETCYDASNHADRLTLYLNDSSYRRVVRLCGNSTDLKHKYVSQGNVANVTFFSGSQVQGHGFTLQYRATGAPNKGDKTVTLASSLAILSVLVVWFGFTSF
ncbi:uncharacterized protein LOC101855720 [Aplysia californica]|uniref:Uncharacterized protein LOC101855720 n=1 Tax=Aplysia californica TaxID=6500 RepID=A0ABM0JM18_APLCA|nr:uncharacterized protein LOC101855720 [Aplysia californica]